MVEVADVVGSTHYGPSLLPSSSRRGSGTSPCLKDTTTTVPSPHTNFSLFIV